jgi:hypothetical protein
VRTSRNGRLVFATTPLLAAIAVACSDGGIIIEPFDYDIDLTSGSTGGSASEAGAGGSSTAGGAGAAGSDVSGGGGGTGGTAGGSGGSGGATPIVIDYDPVGIGDPWFFEAPSELDEFVVAFGGTATGTAVWEEPGQIRVHTEFAAHGDDVTMHFTTAWDSVAQVNTPVDMTDRVLRARLRVAGSQRAVGEGPLNAGVQTFVQSAAGWDWTAGDWHGVGSLDEFTDIEFDMTAAADSSRVVRFGLQLYSNQRGTADLIIDDLRLEPAPLPPPQPDAGGAQTDAGAPPVEAADAGGASADAGGEQ